jgi:hypothetical protein
MPPLPLIRLSLRMGKRKNPFCCFCSGEWSARLLKDKQDSFHALNPSRDPASNTPLNDDQVAFLRVHFCGFSGKLERLCYCHCAKFACVSERTVSSLVASFKKDSFEATPDLENAPEPPEKKPKHNKTPEEIGVLVRDWCLKNSHDVPTSLNIRRFCAPLTSKRRAHRQFLASHPEIGYLSWTIFWREVQERCPHIKVNLQYF